MQVGTDKAAEGTTQHNPDYETLNAVNITYSNAAHSTAVGHVIGQLTRY